MADGVRFRSTMFENLVSVKHRHGRLFERAYEMVESMLQAFCRPTTPRLWKGGEIYPSRWPKAKTPISDLLVINSYFAAKIAMSVEKVSRRGEKTYWSDKERVSR